MKPKLLVVELWGLGDLIIATPFLQAASHHYQVTLVAKPYAEDLRARFWSGVKVVPFVAPWTAFTHKYRLLSWSWPRFARLRKELASERFDFGLSARWDPRDHLLLQLVGAKVRLGFPRLGSQYFLGRPLNRPDPQSHRYENWRVLAQAMGFELPVREALALPQAHRDGEILVHTGAGQAVRVWPLERYSQLVARLRQANYRVLVAADPDQQKWRLGADVQRLATPRTVAELLCLLDRASLFIGNDSGPGHLAAFAGVPTFTVFGPQVPEWFVPLHPASEWLEGKACPYKPCSDYCRFPVQYCMVNSGEEEVWGLVEKFARRMMSRP
jgi:ADP-heptose:LPS heptosyltransferase